MNNSKPKATNIHEEIIACSQGDPRLYREFLNLTKYDMYAFIMLG